MVGLSVLMTQPIFTIKGVIADDICKIGILQINFFLTYACFCALLVYIPQIGLLCENNLTNKIALQQEFDKKKNIADLEIKENKANEKANENPPPYSEV